MDTSSTLARIVGSALAGAAGFLVGFYAGFFLILVRTGTLDVMAR